MDDYLFPFLGVLILVGLVAALFAKPSPELYAMHSAIRERIRREVNQEFDAAIRQSTGVRKWGFLLKREWQISKRAARVIHGRP